MNTTRRLSLKREALSELTNGDLSSIAGANAITYTCKTIIEQTLRYCTFMSGCGSNTHACTHGC